MAFKILACKAENSRACPLGAETCRSRRRNIRVDANSDVRAKRVEMLKADVKMLYDRKWSDLTLVDKAARDMFQKELDVRKALVDKWVEIAKEDIEVICSEKSGIWVCKAKTDVNETSHVSGGGDGAAATGGNMDAVGTTVVNAFYEPWVIDD